MQKIDKSKANQITSRFDLLYAKPGPDRALSLLPFPFFPPSSPLYESAVSHSPALIPI